MKTLRFTVDINRGKIECHYDNRHYDNRCKHDW